MPLPNPVPRKLMHTRAIECNGYEREDGLWDIEAHLTDTKTVATFAAPRRARAPVRASRCTTCGSGSPSTST